MKSKDYKEESFVTTKFFIAGTDTDAGKTYVSVGLLKRWQQLGYTTLGFKPLASGCHRNQQGQLRNDDALALQQASSLQLPYEQVNPLAFERPIAPHIAARENNMQLSVAQLQKLWAPKPNASADIWIIEGVGGWHMPLNEHETMADFVKLNDFAVILVVRIRLGCLNHSILTVKAMQQAQIKFCGWIANIIDPDIAEIDNNIQMLQSWLKAPMLGQVGYQQAAEKGLLLNSRGDLHL